ncbi:MAG: TraR/DksA family transcriptional regulator [Pseudomonadales bacterium]
MTTAAYNSHRDHLERMAEDARARLERLDHHLRHADGPVAADFAEQATEVENDETIAALRLAIGHELDLIQQALERIRAGRYGACQQCHETVEPERLAALPSATLCMRCAGL